MNSILLAYILEELVESRIDMVLSGKEVSLLETLTLRLQDVMRNYRDRGIEFCQEDIDNAVSHFETWHVQYIP